MDISAQGLSAFLIAFLTVVTGSAIIESHFSQSALHVRWLAGIGIMVIQVSALAISASILGFDRFDSTQIVLKLSSLFSIGGGAALSLLIFGTAAFPLRVRKPAGPQALFDWPSTHEDREETLSSPNARIETPGSSPSIARFFLRWRIRLIVGLVALGCVAFLSAPSFMKWHWGLIEAPAVYFSPKGGASESVEAAINNAKSEIRIAMFSFTRRPIRDALIKAKQERDLDIQVILDRRHSTNSDEGKETLRRLKEAGIPMKFSVGSGYMHHKYAVIDRETVITGSFNWTGRGEGVNKENIVILNSASTAERYLENYAQLPCNNENPLDKKDAAAALSTYAGDAEE
jgi:hypothetical protein